MISFLLIAIFVIGYACIAFEHPLRLNKAASALITGVLCWTVYILANNSDKQVSEELLSHFSDISSILFFLLGAMTIVELIDSHSGFEILTSRIKTKDKRKLLFIISFITFFLSAVLDNLTTAIVMTSLIRKLLPDKEDRYWFAGMIIISANAGGVWSPLGDVTTTMLWIDGQVTALNIIYKTFLPSLAVAIIPLYIISFRFKGKFLITSVPDRLPQKSNGDGKVMLLCGIGFLLFVPTFKTLTHLPPFMGMFLALGLIWIITTIIHSDKNEESRKKFTVAKAMQRIDTPSILFFAGILLAVACLESSGLLKQAADFLNNTFQNNYLIGSSLGVLSAIVDNVPLIAASQGMYSLSVFPTDHYFWEFLALTCGTGGSILIIGSAAGVAVMGIENISFGWYLKKISWLALLGFFAGILVYILQQMIFFQ